MNNKKCAKVMDVNIIDNGPIFNGLLNGLRKLKTTRITSRITSIAATLVLVSQMPAGSVLRSAMAHTGHVHLENRYAGILNNFPEPASEIMKSSIAFHDFVMVLMLALWLFVLGLMAYAIFRYRAKRNPVPSKTTHNVGLEIVWTVIPTIIVLILIFPATNLLRSHSFIPDGKRVYGTDDVVLPAPKFTIKATGRQWYWTYEYTNEQGESFEFDSFMLEGEELAAAQAIDPTRPKLLAVDNPIYAPVNTTVELIITAGAEDVIHAFAMPALGVKIDAVPGRLNQGWFNAYRTGTFYGQCSELCGVGHAFMPIELNVVGEFEFDNWFRSNLDLNAAAAPTIERAISEPQELAQADLRSTNLPSINLALTSLSSTNKLSN